MKPDEFRELMKSNADVDLLDVCLHSEDHPFVCKDADGWTAFRAELANGVDGLGPGDIRVVGSARHGFSMKPKASFKAFTDDSDIDVVVVNAEVFDSLWVWLLEAAYPRLYSNQKIGGWLGGGRKELFAGWLTPTAIQMDWKIVGRRRVPLSTFKRKWFEALKLAAGKSTKSHRDIQGRLYRTWRHAELYHLYSIAELRRSMEKIQ